MLNMVKSLYKKGQEIHHDMKLKSMRKAWAVLVEADPKLGEIEASVRLRVEQVSPDRQAPDDYVYFAVIDEMKDAKKMGIDPLQHISDITNKTKAFVDVLGLEGLDDELAGPIARSMVSWFNRNFKKKAQIRESEEGYPIIKSQARISNAVHDVLTGTQAYADSQDFRKRVTGVRVDPWMNYSHFGTIFQAKLSKLVDQNLLKPDELRVLREAARSLIDSKTYRVWGKRAAEMDKAVTIGDNAGLSDRSAEDRIARLQADIALERAKMTAQEKIAAALEHENGGVVLQIDDERKALEQNVELLELSLDDLGDAVEKSWSALNGTEQQRATRLLSHRTEIETARTLLNEGTLSSAFNAPADPDKQEPDLSAVVSGTEPKSEADERQEELAVLREENKMIEKRIAALKAEGHALKAAWTTMSRSSDQLAELANEAILFADSIPRISAAQRSFG